MNETDRGELRRARRAVIRGSVIWTPFFVAFAALAVNFLVRALDGSTGSWVAFAFFGLIGLLSGYSAIAALRDLFADPVETEGVISRKWTKSDMLIFRGHYLLVHKRVFRVRSEVYTEMPNEGARIQLQHYPHTNALVRWQRLREVEAEPEPFLARSSYQRDATAAAPPRERSALPHVRPPRFQPPPAPVPPDEVTPPSFGVAEPGEGAERASRDPGPDPTRPT